MCFFEELNGKSYEEPYDDMVYINRSVILTEQEIEKFIDEIYNCMVYDFLTDEDVKSILKICDVRLNDIVESN